MPDFEYYKKNIKIKIRIFSWFLHRNEAPLYRYVLSCIAQAEWHYCTYFG